MSAFQYCYFGNQNPRSFKWYIKISLVEIFEFVFTNSKIIPRQSVVEVVTWLTEGCYKGWEKAISFYKVKWPN